MGISFSLCDVDMETGAGITAQQGKEEVGLSSKKKLELSGGRSRELILGLNRGRCAWGSSREAAELLC